MKTTEMNKLIVMLAKADIPFEIFPFKVSDEPAFLVASPNEKDRVIDAVCHKFSYGGEEGFLEVMATGICEYDDVIGYLTAEQAFEYFVKYVKKN